MRILPGREDMGSNVNSFDMLYKYFQKKSGFGRLIRYIYLVSCLQNSCCKCTSYIDLKCKVIILFMRGRKLSRQKTFHVVDLHLNLI